jgi:hypothetical protein
VAEISRELGSSQGESPSIGCSKSRGARTRSGEGARGSGPSIEEDACRRSKDLANSEARRVKAQAFGTKSHEVASKREKDSRWIRITGGPLDPREGSCLGTSQEEVREFWRGDREVARRRYPDSWRIVWAIAESASGVQVARSPRDLAARSPEVLALGVAKCRGAEICVDAWQNIRWDRAADGWTHVGWR